jgi:O-acetyl-ADP-ribose deacetylase (regulator of RNase III)
MSKIELIKGSCVDQKVDAIVNAANKYMQHVGGVAYAIRKRAGSEIDVACRSHNLPVNDGEVITTPAFNITNAKIVIHAVGPDFNYKKDAFEELYNAYYNSLIELMNNNYHSIAFPLISASIFGGNLPNPVKESTKQCLRAYNKFIEDFKDYDIDVKLCAFLDSEYNDALELFK